MLDDVLEKPFDRKPSFQLMVLRRSIFDMMLYTMKDVEEIRQLDLGLEWAQLGRDLMPYDVAEEHQQERNNRFLMMPQYVNDNDYDAGFYGYM